MGEATIADRVDRLRRLIYAPRVYCVRRPIQVFERGPVDGVAVLAEERQFLDVLINRVTGRRSVLQKLTANEDIDLWHKMAEDPDTVVLDCPLTCTREQLPVFLDTESENIFAFGGNQSGKSSIGGHWLFNGVLARRGLYMWAAPSQEKTQVGVEKLVRDTKFAKAVIPPDLVVSFPENEKAGDQAIRLIDGSKIDLRYCSRKGGNLKGLVGVERIVMDEGTEVQHEVNFTIATARTLLSGGQVLVPTTPVKGHWLEAKDATVMTYEEIAEHAANGHPRPVEAKVVLSIYDNPWVSREKIDRKIESLGGVENPKVKREYLGQWVRDGVLKWTHFNEQRHTVSWAHRDVERYGFIDITSLVGRELFKGFTQAKTFQWLGGQDYNFNPYSLGVCKFIVPKGVDQSDSDNWIFYVEDCVVKRARSTAEYGDWLAAQAGAWNGRGLAKDAYAGMHIVGDGQGFYRNRDRRVNVSADADEMKAAGFVVRAPRYTSENRQPANPPEDVRVSWMNDLLYRNRMLINVAPMRHRVRCEELLESLTTEIRGKKTPGSVADQKSGITDGVSYLAYAALYHRRKVAQPTKAPAVMGWS